ncbi:MAG TPA: hypothetical protein VHA55_01565 [Pseudorhodoplanes sp.]|jgi:hypothetical protein|nr:hypothetical protein [Pseudorhodoplanes sp.]
MKAPLAGAAVLLALCLPAVAIETCQGEAPEQVDCLRRNQAELQRQVEALRAQLQLAGKAAETAAAPNPAPAAAKAPGWIEDERGCKVWNANPGPDETITWTGPCKRGIANGQGVLIWYWSGSPHGVFIGTLRAGHYHRGMQVWSTGSRFDGAYRNDRAEGPGVYRAATGEIFAGRWVNGCFRDGPRRAAIGVPVDECLK